MRRPNMSATALSLFDDFVGTRQDRRRNRHTECFRRPQIHDQFKPARLLHGQVRRFGSLQYFCGINPGLAIRFGDACRVADQPSLDHEFAQIVYRRKAMLCDQLDQDPALARESGAAADHQRACAGLGQLCDGSGDPWRISGLGNDKRLLKPARGGLSVGQVGCGAWPVRIEQNSDNRGIEHQLPDKLQALRRELTAAPDVNPVALPPGCARLATRPRCTGSSDVTNTIGTVAEIFLAASAAKLLATISDAPFPVGSAASSGRRASSLSAYRSTIRTLASSTKPACFSPSRKALAMCRNGAAGVLRRNPMTGGADCAATACGPTNAPAPVARMKSRRLIAHPRMPSCLR